MKISRAISAFALPLPFIGVASAQSGHMTNEGMGGFGWMGGYGGAWLPILLVLAAVGLVAWIVKQKGK
jgi:uncharacterized membrane protein